MGGFIRGGLLGAINVVVAAAAYAGPPVLQNDRHAARLYELAAREAQFQSLAAIPDADVEYSNFGRLRRLEGHTGIGIPEILSAKRGDSALAVLRKLKPILLASGAEQLKVRQVVSDGYGGYYIFTDQEIDGIPVLDAGLNLQTTSLGEVRTVTSRFIPHGRVSDVATLPLEEAKHRLGEMLIAAGLAMAPSLTLSAGGSRAYWTDEGRAESPRLV